MQLSQVEGLVNSTVGIFGLIDVADDFGLEQKKKILDKTLATGSW